MKAIVFGSTGFIGSHTVEQLVLKGHEVTAVVRSHRNVAFFKFLDVRIVEIDYSDTASIKEVIEGHEVVYNCIGSVGLSSKIDLEHSVEIELTKKLVRAASLSAANRFIQLSSIVVYDFHSSEPLDESYCIKPQYPIQQLLLRREEIVRKIGEETGITTIILRPASAIGRRDYTSFFSRLFQQHMNDQFPLVKNGKTKVSLVDTRDVGRAMEWLGRYPFLTGSTNIFVLKGFDTTWRNLKEETDEARGMKANIYDLSYVVENPMSYSLKTFHTDRIWNDGKIRNLGFTTKYSQKESIKDAVQSLLEREKDIGVEGR
ncbi:NAD(P)-dependent oxidoreductase [Priestia filamentosa]|uniref:NAD-dependent epimerase/dehydratase family protein n=1 Tax=Priestia filamentosa TaxID=1402861 RepID=UPI001FB205B4|nr:NAD(P)-dependent oxidoreductase [Priestia filamentosa]UOE58641.1 NAD(P)-dependent oxidoreductase [Priestia filamentosa]